ncbi:MAG: hypothetical protein QME74_01290, partial [Candidatus Edwardsbacteria bacterium]|nr:hypothetical protein [Candidatus Edwardsbacteria bacterium]
RVLKADTSNTSGTKKVRSLTDKLFDPLSAALVVSDVTTTRLKWNTGHTDRIAPNVKLGLSYRLLPAANDDGWFSSEGIILAGDVEQQVKTSRQKRWHKPVYHLGAEWKAVKLVPLRIGYDNGEFACGIGFITRHFKLDYAYKSQNELKAVHRVAITGIL